MFLCEPDPMDLLSEAVELSRHCPPSSTAYSVGAVVVAGSLRATGWSRRTDPADHAEEIALLGGEFSGGTVYTSMEPCSTRVSRPRACTELIIAAGIVRVVFALREPPLFADCRGAELLAAAGIEVVEVPELAPAVREINAHLLG
jgi:pyrimidine deaminase RibD-like protein